MEIALHPDKPLHFCLWLRNPEWSKEMKITCAGASIRREGAFWQVRKMWKEGDTIAIHFDQAIREVPALGNEIALQYGPLLYVLPVKGETQTVKTYANSTLRDYYVTPSGNVETGLALPAVKRAAGFGFSPETITVRIPITRSTIQPSAWLAKCSTKMARLRRSRSSHGCKERSASPGYFPDRRMIAGRPGGFTPELKGSFGANLLFLFECQ